MLVTIATHDMWIVSGLAPAGAARTASAAASMRSRRMLAGHRGRADLHRGIERGLERLARRHQERGRAHAVARRIEAGRLLPRRDVAQGLQQEAPDLGDGGVADAQILDGAVGDRAHAFLDAAILGPEAADAGVVAAFLERAVDQVIVVAVLLLAVGAGDE